jgi:hypothetical protein
MGSGIGRDIGTEDTLGSSVRVRLRSTSSHAKPSIFQRSDRMTIHSRLSETLEAAVSAGREMLIEERRSIRQQLAEWPGDQATQWIESIDEIAPGSFDVLTLSVYCPA